MESFLYVTKKLGLSFEELDLMDIGGILDYLQEYADSERELHGKSDKNTTKKRKATQADFDRF